jgi:hypothetical protein
MESVKAGTYSAKGQPDIIVLYDGHLCDDKEHHGPWIQWRFPWEKDEEYKTTLCFQFEEMLRAAEYVLIEKAASKEMQFK